jgi:uncharacterized protein YbaR (Trm112 family)
VYVELIDALRCPRPHEPTWLVAAAHSTRDRCVLTGTLGCPACRTTYPITGGVARFGGVASPPPGPPLADPAGDALRLAALLGLADGAGIVAVSGSWDAAVDPLLEAVAGAADLRVLVDEPAGAFAPRPPVGAVAGAPLPVAAGALRGVALDAATATPARLAARSPPCAPAAASSRPPTRPCRPACASWRATPATGWPNARRGRRWPAPSSRSAAPAARRQSPAAPSA